MDDFETISLENKECKICKQETGEELISCILREKFSTAENVSPTSPQAPETSFAHRVCLERWDEVMKNTFFPQPKKTWKDRIKGFISTGPSNNNATETWTPVVSSGVKPSDSSWPIFESTKRGKARSPGTAAHSVFSESKEVYRVENAGNKESEYGPWRGTKVRICSVDSDDGEDERPADSTNDKKIVQHTRAKLQECDVVQLKEFIDVLKLQINDVSSDLITHLQERDGLLLQKHTMKVTVGQLINLQSNIKTSSVQNIPRPTPSVTGHQDILPCT